MMHSRNVGDVIDKETGVDFNHFIEITIQKKMPWKSLAFILFHFAPTLEKSQQVIEILVKELELWVTKVENNQIKVSEVDNGHYVDSLENSGKANSEDESIVSDSEISNDVDVFENGVEERKDSFEMDHKQAFDEHVNIPEDKLEGTPKMLQDAGRKLDLVASRFYEFIGDDDTDSKDIDEVLSVEEVEKDSSNTNCVKEKEDSFEVEFEIPNEEETTTINVSEGKKHQCNFCDKYFAKPSWKVRHERIHTGEKPFECEACLKAFKNRGTLYRHKKVHFDEKPYQCQTCKKSFRQSFHLTRHERVHTGKKPYSCETCKKSFSTSSILKVHERIHTGEKPFQCKTCKKSFRMSYNLTRHERSHSGERPYQCRTCTKCFGRSSNLKRHEKTHADDKTL